MNENQTNWRDLIHAAKAHESAAVTELIERTQKALFSFCFYLVKNREAAEDLAHDTYIKALRSLHQLEKPEAIVAWLKQIARSLNLDRLRSSKHEKTMSLQDFSELERSLDESVDAFDKAPLVSQQVPPAATPLTDRLAALQVLQQLSEEEQAILILIDIQGGTYEEASQVLDIPEGTVKSRLSRARQKFSLLFQGTK